MHYSSGIGSVQAGVFTKANAWAWSKVCNGVIVPSAIKVGSWFHFIINSVSAMFFLTVAAESSPTCEKSTSDRSPIAIIPYVSKALNMSNF